MRYLVVKNQEARYDEVFGGQNAERVVRVMFLEVKLQQVRSG